MKYEVIGWTETYCETYPNHGCKTASVDMAIAKEIRQNGYLFGGDEHDEYCPVLNDGTKACYSWREWGRIMALAYDWSGDMSYMNAYMSMCINSEKRKYPIWEFPKDYLILPKDKLVEVITMHLSDDMFCALKSGSKTIEIRLFDNKRKQIDYGDYIKFIKSSDDSQFVIRKVADIGLAVTFEKMFELIMNNKSKRKTDYTPVSLGFSRDTKLQDFVDEMHKYYKKEQENEFNVIALYLEKPKHTCLTYFSIWFEPSRRLELYKELVHNQLYSDDEIYTLFKEDDTLETCAVKAEVRKIIKDVEQFEYWFRLGLNKEYNMDVNLMIKKTLKSLFGKEKELKKIQQELCVPMILNVYATIIKDSEEPKQNFQLSDDVLEFLNKTGIKLNLEKRII